MSSFRSDDARDTYESGFYNPVLQAANDWYQGKLQESRASSCGEFRKALAASNDPVKFDELRSETEQSEFAGTLSDLETSSVLVDAAYVAVGMSRFSRANDLLDPFQSQTEMQTGAGHSAVRKKHCLKAWGASVTSELMSFK